MYHSYQHSCKVLIQSIYYLGRYSSFTESCHKVPHLHFIKTKISLEQDEKLTKGSFRLSAHGYYLSRQCPFLGTLPRFPLGYGVQTSARARALGSGTQSERALLDGCSHDPIPSHEVTCLKGKGMGRISPNARCLANIYKQYLHGLRG